MKREFGAFALLVLFFLSGINSIKACLPNVESFRKVFRHSKQVFVGEIIEVGWVKKEELPQNLQEATEGLAKITFKIDRSWKGKNVAQEVLYSKLFCTCPDRTNYFTKGKKFLVFSDKQSYFDACSLLNAQVDPAEIPVDSWEAKFVKNKIDRLDDFWFRLWAKIYPF
jgi:hypothetical protein